MTTTSEVVDFGCGGKWSPALVTRRIARDGLSYTIVQNLAVIRSPASKFLSVSGWSIHGV